MVLEKIWKLEKLLKKFGAEVKFVSWKELHNKFDGLKCDKSKIKTFSKLKNFFHKIKKTKMQYLCLKNFEKFLYLEENF